MCRKTKISLHNQGKHVREVLFTVVASLTREALHPCPAPVAYEIASFTHNDGEHHPHFGTTKFVWRVFAPATTTCYLPHTT